MIKTYIIERITGSPNPNGKYLHKFCDIFLEAFTTVKYSVQAMTAVQAAEDNPPKLITNAWRMQTPKDSASRENLIVIKFPALKIIDEIAR